MALSMGRGHWCCYQGRQYWSMVGHTHQTANCPKSEIFRTSNNVGNWAVTRVQLSVVRKKLSVVADGRWRKLSVVTDGATGKRSAVLNFYPYRTRISSHNLPLATVCIKYEVHMPSIYTYMTIRHLY